MRGCRAELRRHERHEITVSVRYASASVMAALFPVADLIIHILPGPPLLTQSPGRGRADGRARLIAGPHHDLALDADLCSGGAAPVARAGQAQRIDLAHGRDLCADLWSLDVPVPPRR